MDAHFQAQLDQWISETTGSPFTTRRRTAASGGCIHQSFVLEDDTHAYFIKVNRRSALDQFAAEAQALERLDQSHSLRVPRAIGCVAFDEQSVLVLERLHFGSGRTEAWQRMGQELAALHRVTSDRFGWQADNFIGASPQANQWHKDWASFFVEQRLRPQFAMARAAGLRLSEETACLQAVDSLLADHQPQASLLHGDLWSGNAGFLEDGCPVIYDPASYYGDRETDLAFSEFFGGFPTSFYRAYAEAWPLEPGYPKRKTVYNLYHVLNHANLFGGGYLRQAEQMIAQILKS